jgi:hypothetical protein
MPRAEFCGYALDVQEPGHSHGTLTRPDATRTELPPIPSALLLCLFAAPGDWINLTTCLPVFKGMTHETLKTHASRTRAAVAGANGQATIRIEGAKTEVWRVTGDDRNFVEDEDIVGVFNGVQYHVAQASREDIVWAARLAARTYGGIDVIPESTMLSWWQANPTGFSCLFRNGERIGNLDVLPLRKPALEKFVGGTLIERELAGADLFTPHEQDQITDLYVESIVIERRKDRERRGAEHMLLAFQDIARRVCRPRKECCVYAISATKPGENLLQGLGFDLIGTPAQRRDEHQLWNAPLPAVLRRIAQRLRVPADDDFGPLLDGGL